MKVAYATQIARLTNQRRSFENGSEASTYKAWNRKEWWGGKQYERAGKVILRSGISTQKVTFHLEIVQTWKLNAISFSSLTIEFPNYANSASNVKWVTLLVKLEVIQYISMKKTRYDPFVWAALIGTKELSVTGGHTTMEGTIFI